MYLFSLPFVLVKELGWATVPVVTVVAFTFMGIETIADIIEMPFGMCFHPVPPPSLTLGYRERLCRPPPGYLPSRSQRGDIVRCAALQWVRTNKFLA